MIYDAKSVVTVPVKRGVVTHVVLDADESIVEVAAGQGGDCSKQESAWCVAAQPGGHGLFVKPKSNAKAPNNLAVVTDKRLHSFKFVVLDDQDARQPVYRLAIKAPTRYAARLSASATPTLPSLPTPKEIVSERLKAKAQVRNSNYSLAEGDNWADIVPSLIFDDGRFTYMRFPGNREIPAVFHVLGDGSETLVNTRMEDDLLVVDRVSRRLTLRAGHAVVGVWNDDFDLDGQPPVGGSTVPGVQRAMKADSAGASQ